MLKMNMYTYVDVLKMYIFRCTARCMTRVRLQLVIVDVNDTTLKII